MSALLPEVVVLSNETDLLASHPAPVCQVSVTQVRLSPAALGDTSASVLTVAGLAWGADKVTVHLQCAGHDATLDADVQSLHWSVPFDLGDTAVAPGSVAHIEAGTGATSNCQARDRAVLALGVAGQPVVAPGCPSEFDAGRVGLLAGHPSRVVEMQTFSSLANSGVLANLRKNGWSKLNLYQADTGKPARLAAGTQRISDSVALTAGAPQGFRLTHQISLPDYVEKLTGSTRGAADKKRKAKSPPATAGTLRRRALTDSLTEAAAGTQVVAQAPSIVITTPVGPGGPNLDPSIPGILLTLELLLKAIARIDSLGVLFYDELHFRPIGLVAGEPLYQLSLAPGEEVVLTEEHTSKRSTSLEEIKDRESERNLEFESSWTTDVTQTLANELQAKIGGHLGGEVTIPETPVKLDAGVDPEVASKQTQEFVVKLVNEVSRKMTARMREQHKTTLTVSTEETRGTGTQRTLWNPNPSRVLDLTYYKLYRKERLTLQRHDAKLCLAVYVEDPARQARDIFLEGLGRLDPTNPELYNCILPATEDTTTQSKTHSGFGVWDPFSRLVGFQFDFSIATLTPGNPASDLVLAGATLRVTSWVVSFFDGHEEAFSGGGFANGGGKVYFGGPIAPVRLDPPGKPGYEIHVEAPLSIVPFAWVTKKVVVEVEATWMPEPTTASAFTACMQDEQTRLRDSFSVESVAALAERVRSLARKQVYGRLIDEYLLATDPLQTQASPEQMDKIRSLFDWNEAVVEYLPWWLTPYSREKYEQVREALRKLPGDFAVDELIADELVSARARVYLPLKPGAEREALEVIGLNNIVTDTLVDQFETFRDTHFGVLDRPLPSYEAISSPRPMHGTPQGSGDWDEHWEKPPRKFQVLADWSDLLPTDGIHCEPSLSACTATDEVRTADLRRRQSDVDLKK